MTKPVLSVIDCLRSHISNPYLEGLADSEVLRRFVESDSPDAFICLMQRHGSMVLGLARRIVRDHHLAEDVFQATFLTLGRKARAIRGRASLAAWLHSIAFRLAVRAMKQRRRSVEVHARVTRIPQPDPLDELTAREFLTILDQELNALPEKYRLPLILCHLEGLTREEAAKRLRISVPSVKARLERGRERLRLRLTKRGLGAGAVLTASLQFGQSAMAVPHALVQSTLSAALCREGASAVAVALTNGAIKMMFLAKLQNVCLAVALLGITGLGTTWLVQAGASHDKEQSASAPAAPVAEQNRQAKEKRVDLYGDALPDGAVMRLGTVQLRAAGAQLALSPDGKTLVGLKGGGYLSFWDAETGRLRETRLIPRGSKGAAEIGYPIGVLSPDGRFVAYANRRGSLEVWEVASGKSSHKLTDKEALNVRVGPIFSQDGRQLAAGWVDEKDMVTIRVWDLVTGKSTFTQVVRGGVGLGSFTPDGKKLFISFYPSNTIEGAYLFDIAAGKQLWHAKDFYSASWVAFTPNGQLLSIEGTRDLATGKVMVNRPPPPVQQDESVILMPDGRRLLYSQADGVHIWDLVTDKQLGLLAGAGREMVLAPDHKTLITSDGALQRWELSTGKRLYVDNFASGHTRDIVGFAFSKDGTRLASSANDGSVRFWDATTGQPIHVWRAQARLANPSTRSEEVDALDMTPDGRWIIAGGGGGQLRVWDTIKGKQAYAVALPKPKENGRPWVYHLRIRPDGKRVVALLSWQFPFAYTAAGQEIPLTDWLTHWDLPTGNLLSKAPVQITNGQLTNGICSSLSCDGRTLVTWDKLIKVATGIEIVRLQDGNTRFHGIPSIHSPDGSLVAGANISQKGQNVGVHIWETATGRIIAHLNTTSWSHQLRFDPGNRFVAVNEGDAIQVWDVVTEKVVATLPMNHTDIGRYTRSLAFTPDGRRLATGHPDGTILLWNIDLPVAKPVPLAAKDIEPLWTDLKDADAAKAWRAVWRLVDSPDEVVPYLQKRLTPFPAASEKTTGPLLADLDNGSFAKREAAQKRLLELGIAAEPALRARLKANPSLESQRRLEAILKTIVEAPQPLTAESLRGIRAVAVLARINSPSARSILQKLATGVESARLTRAASAALGR